MNPNFENEIKDVRSISVGDSLILQYNVAMQKMPTIELAVCKKVLKTCIVVENISGHSIKIDFRGYGVGGGKWYSTHYYMYQDTPKNRLELVQANKVRKLYIIE